ncbi:MULTISPECIES: adenylate/guanylate cyclase domain-containing protein [Kordiimonas]|jgi:class 3 adenylate cyclase|uniref:Adenylate cyclase, class 3 n=1 Tax=Kordiimonas lacus TaxID=637679 RepID=A0A1G6YMI8_9PROT|nr:MULTISPECIES: adenylate/guanylate cyclase domain-containing protein [Kordiimonas]SDD91521.1 Adenylate cyclase, class 3 [Kordiimonas lacus]
MSLSEEAIQALQGLDTAVAVINPTSWEPVFENAAFFRFFPCSGGDGETIFDRVAGLDRDKLEKRLGRGRKYEFAIDVRQDPRTICLNLVFHPASEEQPLVLLEAQNVTKQREAELMLDSYSKMSEKARRELEREKERVEKLLLNIMPRSVYEEMKDYGTTTPQKFDSASVLMLDFVDFTEMAVARDPGALIAELNDIFSAFDRIVELFDCERIKTIGDAYMAVAGLPEPNSDHATQLARVALRMKRYLEKRNAAHPTQWRFRIGIATGPLIGSIVGIQKYVYDVFGPAVNLAARLESACEPMKITVCQPTEELIRNNFSLTQLPLVDVKGFGEQQLYTLDFEDRS